MSFVNSATEESLKCDILVIGGGPGGVSAAVMAARCGASVILAERYGVLGGMSTVGEVSPFMGNYQNNVLANIIFVYFQQQGERGLTNAPDEDPDDLSTGYYGSAYRSPENWTTALRSSHFNTAARRGIISDRFVEAILQFWREK